MRGVGPAGDIIEGVAGYNAGMLNKKAMNINADNAARDGVGEESATRDAARAAMGEQIAGQGASGLELGTGSALEALHQSQVNAQLDAMAIRRKTASAVTGYKLKAFDAKNGAMAAFGKGIGNAVKDYAAAGGGGG